MNLNTFKGRFKNIKSYRFWRYFICLFQANLITLRSKIKLLSNL